LITLFSASCLGLIGYSWREAADRDRLVVATAVASGTIALALGIGWGRSGFGPYAGFAVRYALLAFPIVGAGYLVWLQFGGRVFGSLVPTVMFTISCLFLTQHCRTGLAEGRQFVAKTRAFDADLAAGLPPDELATRHPDLFPCPDRFPERLRQLRDSGFARYRAIGADPTARIDHH
jgi:hypothetical protein